MALARRDRSTAEVELSLLHQLRLHDLLDVLASVQLAGQIRRVKTLNLEVMKRTQMRYLFNQNKNERGER
jgi:hypothetical protein